MVVVPATADLMAKMAGGLANDLASTTLLATDKKLANAQFSLATSDRMYKKDAGILTAIAAAYFKNKDDELGKSFLNKARSANQKSPLSYLLEGDLLIAQKNPSEASAKYENAVYFDPACKAAYVKLARIYENIKFDIRGKLLCFFLRV